MYVRPGHISETTEPISTQFSALNNKVFRSAHSKFHWNHTRIRVCFLPSRPARLFGEIQYMHPIHYICKHMHACMHAFFAYVHVCASHRRLMQACVCMSLNTLGVQCKHQHGSFKCLLELASIKSEIGYNSARCGFLAYWPYLLRDMYSICHKCNWCKNTTFYAHFYLTPNVDLHFSKNFKYLRNNLAASRGFFDILF